MNIDIYFVIASIIVLLLQLTFVFILGVVIGIISGKIQTKLLKEKYEKLGYKVTIKGKEMILEVKE